LFALEIYYENYREEQYGPVIYSPYLFFACNCKYLNILAAWFYEQCNDYLDFAKKQLAVEAS